MTTILALVAASSRIISALFFLLPPGRTIAFRDPSCRPPLRRQLKRPRSRRLPCPSLAGRMYHLLALSSTAFDCIGTLKMDNSFTGLDPVQRRRRSFFHTPSACFTFKIQYHRLRFRLLIAFKTPPCLLTGLPRSFVSPRFIIFVFSLQTFRSWSAQSPFPSVMSEQLNTLK